MVMLEPTTRHSGIEFAVGWYLLALGLGQLIPRANAGLYSMLHAGDHHAAWIAWMLVSALWLICFSFLRTPRARLLGVMAAMACWAMLGLKFMQANLWGATGQAMVSLVLLNACLWRLIHYVYGDHDQT